MTIHISKFIEAKQHFNRPFLEHGGRVLKTDHKTPLFPNSFRFGDKPGVSIARWTKTASFRRAVNTSAGKFRGLPREFNANWNSPLNNDRLPINGRKDVSNTDPAKIRAELCSA
jgi:hypothetical protein